MMKRIAVLVLVALTASSPLVLAQGAEAPQEMQGTVKVGDNAISFSLKDQNGEERTLEGLLNPDGFVALVFYRSADW